jgi:predicted dehydrogenase
MSWDVWKHGHPPIELYGSEGSMRVPDPNFFGGEVEITEQGADWKKVDSAAMPFGKPNWRSPNWPPETPARANYRGLGVAELANAVRTGGPHRASGAFAQHVLEVMYGILQAGETGGAISIEAPLERPAVLDDALARTFWKG